MTGTNAVGRDDAVVSPGDDGWFVVVHGEVLARI